MKEFGFSGAYIEITNRCNLNCATCYNRSGLSKTITETSLEHLKQGIDFLTSRGAKVISLAGGEPLLHSRLPEILKMITKYPHTWFSFVTNGTVHRHDFIEAYHAMPNIAVQVSLDGSREEVNHNTRGQGSFTRAERFIEQLQPTSKQVMVRMTISKLNMHDVDDFFNTILSWNCTPDFAFVNRIGNAQTNWTDIGLSAEEKGSVLGQLMTLKNKHQLEVHLPFASNYCPLADDYENMLNLIKPDGSIQPCQMIYDNRFTLGNLYEFDSKAFLQRCDEVGNLVRTRFESDYNCQKCVVRKRCKHGCMAYAIDLCGEPTANDGECEYRRLQFLVHDMQNIRLKKEAAR